MTRADMVSSWQLLNTGGQTIDLVAVGSPHASTAECRTLADALAGRVVAVPTIVTLGRTVMDSIRADGTLSRLQEAGVRIVTDLCWCSISEPVFPTGTRTIMTNSGKYAHYGPALTGCVMRFGSLSDCAEAAISGASEERLPPWLRDNRPA